MAIPRSAAVNAAQHLYEWPAGQIASIEGYVPSNVAAPLRLVELLAGRQVHAADLRDEVDCLRTACSPAAPAAR